jgi:hypothetical protein
VVDRAGKGTRRRHLRSSMQGATNLTLVKQEVRFLGGS